DRIRIEPEHRNHGYGLYAAELMINAFGPGGGLVACIPAPYELRKDSDTVSVDAAIGSGGDEPAPEWKAAEAKLRQHWSRMGFQQAPGSDVFALSLTTRRPSIEQVIRAYSARKTA